MAFLGTTVSSIPNAIRKFCSACKISVSCKADLPALRPTSFDQLFHQPARLTLCVPTSRSIISIGILTYLPSSTPFGLDLGPDLPYDDEHRVGNLGFSALKILTLIIATHACMLTSIRSTTPCRYGFNAE